MLSTFSSRIKGESSKNHTCAGEVEEEETIVMSSASPSTSRSRSVMNQDILQNGYHFHRPQEKVNNRQTHPSRLTPPLQT